MELQTSIFRSQPDLQVAENVIPLCELARGFEEAGEFEQARETLLPFWQKLGERPDTTGLNDEAKAELLLRTGTLTGWLGTTKQISGAQEIAKDLVSQSAPIFETLGLTAKVAEGKAELASC